MHVHFPCYLLACCLLLFVILRLLTLIIFGRIGHLAALLALDLFVTDLATELATELANHAAASAAFVVVVVIVAVVAVAVAVAAAAHLVCPVHFLCAFGTVFRHALYRAAGDAVVDDPVDAVAQF